MPTLPESAAQRSPSQRMPDSFSLTNFSGIRSSAASSSVVKRGQFDEYEQQAPQAWHGLSVSAAGSLLLSGIARRLPDQALAPFRPEGIAPLRIFFVEIDGVDDTVG